MSFEVPYEESIREAFHEWVDDQLQGDWFLDSDDHQFCTIECACKFNNEYPSSSFAPVLKCLDV